jgi:sugar lactone lactonase YvrE/enterochelin esterase-like enzyme
MTSFRWAVLFTVFAAVLVRADDPVPANGATQETAAAPARGKIVEGVYAQSKIFPGTTRRYSVYIPEEYDPSKPACVYVGQDGLDRRFTTAMDQLIAQKLMPVTVGIFIQPGTLPAPATDQLPRKNRSFEYDSLNSAYASFLLDEMIPFVAKTYQLNLSDRGDDRCIGGGSSGGICAFNVAWERPDAFHRVYSISGSFASIRGGDILPELVRECEPKPLRIFLHVGSNDLKVDAGDWFLDNEEMDRSLKYAGYDEQFQFNDGHHMAMYTEAFSAAMTWLWRDWPAPIKPPVGTSRVQDILVPGASWQEVGHGYRNATGLAASPQGVVYFCDAPAHQIYKVGDDGQAAPFSSDTSGVQALTFGTDGTLYGVASGTGNLLAFDAQGKATILAGGLRGHDLAAMRDGGFYVTSPGPPGTAESKVWHVDAKGGKTEADTGLEAATGVAVSADGYQLYVADGASHWVYVYLLNPDGTLSDKQRFYWLHTPDDQDDAGAEGLAVDQQGLVYVATRMGVQISGLQGHTQGYLPSPGARITSLCFGGPGFNELYISCGDKIYKRQVKSKGEDVFHPPIVNPKGGGL